MTSASTDDPHVETRSIAAGAADLTKVYGTGDTVVEALRGVSIEFPAGEFTAIMGPSGSGKSTLMHCLAGLDVATDGRVHIGDVDLTGLSDKAMTMLRRDRIGFVFQSFNLVPTLTAAENITLPVDIAGRDVDKEWFDAVVDRLGITERLSHLPSELSGGQQQRVACARALVGKPDIIFGDEPTGNLDSRSSGEVLSILRAATDEFGQTVVIVTHDPRAASYADRVVFLADGQIVRELSRPSADDVFEVMKNLDDGPDASAASGASGASATAAGSEASGAHETAAGAHEADPGDPATAATNQATGDHTPKHAAPAPEVR